MKKSILALLLITTSFSAYAATTVTTTTTTTVKTALPQGTYVKNHKVMVKKGYTIEKVSKNRAVIKMRRNNGITGSFDCTCNGNDGGCDVITTPTSVSCAVSSCTSSCYMITTIPGKASGYLFRE